jgi:hypothetical protein
MNSTEIIYIKQYILNDINIYGVHIMHSSNVYQTKYIK